MNQAIIYSRTSTLHQNPKKDIKSCLELAKDKNLQVSEEDIYVENLSGYKMDVVRDDWQEVRERAIKEKKHIILPRYDRTWRNEAEFVKFMREMYIVHDLKVYSVAESYLNEIWNMLPMLETIPAPFDVLMKTIMQGVWDVVVTITGRKAQEESDKKSKSVKNSVVRKEGKPTKSYKGNKWGAPSLPKQTINKILELHEKGFSQRQIQKEVWIYDTHGNKKKNVSLGKVNKEIKKFLEK